MDRMSSDFLFDYASRFAQFSGDECEVNLFHCARGELFGEFAMCVVILSHHETAACFFVETVNDARPFFSTDPRQSGAMAEQRVDQSMFALTCAGMNGEAGWFVDNGEIIVFEENIEWNRLRSRLDLLHRRLNQINLVTAADNAPRSGGFLVEPNESATDQLLKARPGIFRKSLRQKLIKAQLCLIG